MVLYDRSKGNAERLKLRDVRKDTFGIEMVYERAAFMLITKPIMESRKQRRNDFSLLSACTDAVGASDRRNS